MRLNFGPERQRKEDTRKQNRLLDVLGIVNVVLNTFGWSMTMAKQVMVVVMMVALMAGTALADPFNDAADGNWDSSNADTWGVGGVAPYDYPASGDTATIDSNTVTVNIDLTGAAEPDEIILNGGTLRGAKGPLAVDADIRVQDDSNLYGGRDDNYPRPQTLMAVNGVIADYAVGTTGRLTHTGDKYYLVLGNTNTWSGGMDITGGYVRLDAAGAAGTGGIAVSSSAANGRGVTLNLNADMALGSTGAVTVTKNAGATQEATLLISEPQSYGQGGNPAAPSVSIVGGTLSMYAHDVYMSFDVGSTLKFSERHDGTGAPWRVPGTFNFTDDSTLYIAGGYGSSVEMSGDLTGSSLLTVDNHAHLITLTTANPGLSGDWEFLASSRIIADVAGAMGSGDILLTGGELEINDAAAIGPGCNLTITGGVVEYLGGVGGTVLVSGLTLGGTPVDNGVYDIESDSFGGEDFSDYFNGTGTITVAAPSGAIPEPAGLGLLGLALLGLKRRRS